MQAKQKAFNDKWLAVKQWDQQKLDQRDVDKHDLDDDLARIGDELYFIGKKSIEGLKNELEGMKLSRVSSMQHEKSPFWVSWGRR